MIRIVPHHFYTSIVEAPPLIGNECMYPDVLAEPLIRTFSKDIMTPFYFKVGDVYLQPKYTTKQDVFGLCIVVSDEVYNGTEYAELVIAYNLPIVDILSLKRIRGDFPQDCTIDTLLTQYLESSSLVNQDQEFTLTFENAPPFQIFITFQVTAFTIHERPLVDDVTEALNKELHELGLEAKVCQGVNVGVVANHEIKVDFVEPEPEPAPTYTLPEPQKALVDVPPPSKFKGDGLQLTKDAVVPLTREELRQKRCITYGSAEASSFTG